MGVYAMPLGCGDGSNNPGTVWFLLAAIHTVDQPAVRLQEKDRRE